jgi:hypothetical protein
MLTPWGEVETSRPGEDPVLVPSIPLFPTLLFVAFLSKMISMLSSSSSKYPDSLLTPSRLVGSLTESEEGFDTVPGG